MEEKIATRDRILDAASARIMHYGYAKTTMSEIAGDCGMSPGNIYRFFEAKIDIAEALARRHYSQEHARLAAIARKADIAADERLKMIFVTRLRDAFKLFAENGKILEIAQVLHRDRPLFGIEQTMAERVFISAVVRDGIAAGIIPEVDPEWASEMMQAATGRFLLPQLFSSFNLVKLEADLSGVLELLLYGLCVPGRKSAITAS